jgi:hypothetical protein
MADPFQFGDQTIYVDSSTVQPLRESTDVREYDELDVLLQVVAVTGSGNVVVEIITGMQVDTEDGWLTAGTFTAMTATGAQKIHVTGLLRYVRWKATLTGFSNVSLVVSGMMRQRAA